MELFTRFIENYVYNYENKKIELENLQTIIKAKKKVTRMNVNKEINLAKIALELTLKLIKLLNRLLRKI